MDTIPKDEPQPDPATLSLSNQPGASGEKVGFDALRGRKVGDMGFRWATWRNTFSLLAVMVISSSSRTSRSRTGRPSQPSRRRRLRLHPRQLRLPRQRAPAVVTPSRRDQLLPALISARLLSPRSTSTGARRMARSNGSVTLLSVDTARRLCAITACLWR